MTPGAMLRGCHSSNTMWIGFDEIILVLRGPRHICDLMARSQIWIWIAMAIQAPSHTQRLDLFHDLHLVDPSMTGHTTYSRCKVHAVIKKCVVGQHMHIDPANRVSVFSAILHELQVLTPRSDRPMTIQAGGGRRNGCVRRYLDRVVTVSAIQSKIACVELVTEWYRLFWTITYVREIWRPPIGHGEHSEGGQEPGAENHVLRQSIGPPGEDNSQYFSS